MLPLPLFRDDNEGLSFSDYRSRSERLKKTDDGDVEDNATVADSHVVASVRQSNTVASAVGATDFSGDASGSGVSAAAAGVVMSTTESSFSRWKSLRKVVVEAMDQSQGEGDVADHIHAMMEQNISKQAAEANSPGRGKKSPGLKHVPPRQLNSSMEALCSTLAPTRTMPTRTRSASNIGSVTEEDEDGGADDGGGDDGGGGNSSWHVSGSYGNSAGAGRGSSSQSPRRASVSTSTPAGSLEFPGLTQMTNL
jgi:hypothetical protein